MNQDFIRKVTELADKEIKWVFEHDEDCGEIPIEETCDSFGIVNALSYSEPEDATWGRDLGEQFGHGFAAGVRNAMKVIKDNPDILNELLSS